MGNLKHTFRKDRLASRRHAQREFWFTKAREDRDRKEELQDRAESALQDAGAVTVQVTQQAAERLERKVETLSTANTTALIKNREDLEKVMAVLEGLFAQAYVMEDGRRVFRTRDGSAVYDEFGELVPLEELDPELIDPNAPHWEDVAPWIEEESALEADQSDLLAYQAQLDAAEDALANGNMTEAEADALEADLMDAKPPAAAMQMPGYDALGTDADAATPTTAHNKTGGTPVWEPPVLGQ